MSARKSKRILLDPQILLGMNDAFCFQALARTFKRPELAKADCNYHRLFEIPGGKDVSRLPKRCPVVGTVILVFYSAGQIKRFQVTKRNLVACYYSDDVMNFWNCIYSYSLSWKCNRIGEKGQWRRDENYSTLGLSPIVRIVLVRPARSCMDLTGRTTR